MHGLLRKAVDFPGQTLALVWGCGALAACVAVSVLGV